MMKPILQVFGVIILLWVSFAPITSSQQEAKEAMVGFVHQIPDVVSDVYVDTTVEASTYTSTRDYNQRPEAEQHLTSLVASPRVGTEPGEEKPMLHIVVLLVIVGTYTYLKIRSREKHY